MPLRLLPGVALLVLATLAGAQAAGLKQVGTITIPGEPITAFGTIYVDQKTGRAYLADKDNKSIDVIDTKTDKYLSRITGLVGIAKSGDATGPNGFVTINAAEGWAGDGDSTVKVIDLKAGRVTDTISTGGAKRVGELAYDAKDHILIAANPNDQPPFLTLISTRPGHKLLGRITLSNATDSIERSAFYAPTGMFYANVPEVDGVKNKGGLAEIDPRAGRLVRLIALDGCNPHGIAQIGARFYLGCGARADQPVGGMAVVDVRQGKMVAQIAGLGGSGQWAANPKTGRIYSASGNPGSNMLNVIDYKTLKLVDRMQASPGAHSIATNVGTGRVYFPTVAKGGPCGGCIQVFAPAP